MGLQSSSRGGLVREFTLFDIGRQPLVLKGEANAEVPYTCILSTRHKGATPLDTKRSPIVSKFMRI